MLRRWGVRCAAVGCVMAAWAQSVACGSASAGNEAVPGDAGGFDTGTGNHDGSVDSGAADGFGADTGSGDAGHDGGVPPTTALFVQGSPSLPDVRLCWDFGGAVQPGLPFPGEGAMPASNYPGIPLGGAIAMPDATPLAQAGVTLYAVDAGYLANRNQTRTTPLRCEDIICGPGLNPPSPCFRENYDYWPVPMPGGVQPHKPNVVALSGCLPLSLDPTAKAARCGATWTPLDGNLHADVVALAQTFANTGQIAVQAAQLSPSIGALFASAGDAGDAAAPDADASDDAASDAGVPGDAAVGAVVSFGAQDAGDASVIAVLTTEGSLQSAPKTVTVGGGLAAYGALGFAVDVPGLEGGAGHTWMSLVQAQQLVDPTADPSVFFGQPRTYVVAVLGDPNAPHAFTSGGVYDGKGLHVLVVASAAPAVGGDL